MGRFPQSRWLRLVEGVLVTVILVGLFSVLVGPSRVVGELQAADPAVYALVPGLTLVWLLAWSETLLVLLQLRERGIDPWHFRVVFLGGMGVRGAAPGGSVSGAPIMGYVVSTATDVEFEESVAMASVAEFLYWLGSMIVLAAGFAAIFLQGSPSRQALYLTGVLSAVTVLGAMLAVVGMRSPSVVRGLVHALAAAARATVGRVSGRVRRALARETVDRRVDRFFAAFRRLSEHPRILAIGVGAALLGWLALVVALYLTLVALGAEATSFALLFVVPASSIGQAFSVLPGGVGGVEITQGLLLTEIAGVALGTAGTAVVLVRLGTYWFRLGVGALALFYLGIAGTVLEEDVDPEVG